MAASQLGGSNSLRGGKKKFGPKTKCGNWVELDKEPGQAQPPGFPHAMYKTDAQQQMLEGVLQRPKRFGAGLPPPEDPGMDYNRVFNYDKRQGDSQWAGITSTEFTAPGTTNDKGKEFASSFKMAPGISDPAKLKEYRETWTVEADSVRLVRFKTDAVTSANTGVPAKFRLGETRKLPGTPKVVERLREKALAQGQPGIVRARQALQQRASLTGVDLLRPSDLVEGLRGMGLTFGREDAEKVIHFFAKDGKSAASISDVFRGLSAPMSERQRRTIADLFRVVDEAGTGSVALRDLTRRFDAAHDGIADLGSSYEKQEARKALLEYWGMYQHDGQDGITLAGFEEFAADASCGVEKEDEFDAVVASLIGGCPPGRGEAAI